MSEIVHDLSQGRTTDSPWGGDGGYTTVKGKRVKKSEFLQYLEAPKRATVVHSDGNLFLSGLGEWDCVRGGHKRSNTEKPFCMNCWVDL